MLSTPQPSAQPFSTATRVHPSYLPRLNRRHPMPASTGNSGSRWIKSVILVSAIGYTASLYLNQSRERQLQAWHAEETERRRRHEELMDSYGDRSSLEALERAVEQYGKR